MGELLKNEDRIYLSEARRAWNKLSNFKKFLLREFGVKFCLGEEQRENFTGYLPFYLFWCDECESPAKDYPHGYPERRYLNCPNCRSYHTFISFGTKCSVWAANLLLLVAVPFMMLGINLFKKVRR